MDLIVRIFVVAAFLCLVSSSSRSKSFRATEVLPKGCKWQQMQHVNGTPASATDDQDGSQQYNTSKHMLGCKLRTLSGIGSLLGNLSVHQTDRIAELKLECNELLFFVSSLDMPPNQPADRGFLSALRKLVHLQINYCKMKHLPALILANMPNLRSFTLRTHNTDWSAMNLEVHPQSFSGLNEMRKIELSHNNIWSVPNEVFCSMHTLKELNLTHNRLTDVSQLSFSDWGEGPKAPGKTCNAALETLDLSHNDITTLPDNGLTALRSLASLHLQDNLLTTLADRAFVGLHSLQMLNMSSNRLIALPPELFQSTRALTQLYLQNNTLSVLAPDLLIGLDRLDVLDLSQNQLTSAWVNRDTFGGLVRLVVLNLGHNALTKIDQHVFKGLFSLQILNLEHNNIETIANSAFSDLKNLHALTLSHNKIRKIEAFHFAELYVLNQLFLETNLIETIHPYAFENLTNLSDLSLNDNLLTIVPSGLGKLRFLKSLDLGKNQIESVSNASFGGLEQLLGLRMVDNLITNISRDAFAALSSLHVLNLASNHIRFIDPAAFTSNPTLRAIRLDNNQMEELSGIFASLNALVWLNVSDNRLKWFDYSHLPTSLEWLDMHKNNITELGNYFDVRETLQLKMLDVSYNNLQSIDGGNIPDSIETIFMNNNQIKEVAPGTFQKKNHLEKVVLYGNQIVKLDISAVALQSVGDNRQMPQFFIANNPLHCDCHMEWLQRINELSHQRQHPRVLDLDQVMCTMELERGAILRPLMDIKSNEFLCRYESHCFALCHCCDFDACDCKMQCPDRCSCYHDHTWSTNAVDCGRADYRGVPERIPMDATAIYLDGNNLGDLDSHMFIGKKKLEVLFLNDSNINSLHNRTFNGIANLKVLHIEHNHIKELRGFEFDQLRNLKELFVHNNEIAYVGNQTFSNLVQLEVLDLSDNKIKNFEPWQQLRAASDSLVQVSLNGNRWRCNCQSLERLQDWIKRSVSDEEFDFNRMICTDSRILSDVMKECQEIRESAVTTRAVQRTVFIGNGLIGGEYIPLLAAVLVAIIGTALVIVLVCVFRHDVRLWAHAKYGVRLFKDPTMTSVAKEQNEMYDAYVIYSQRDSEFTNRVISTELHHNGYNLCLHYRDIVHLQTPMQSTLTAMHHGMHDTFESSRRLVILLSINFLQNELSKPSFRIALQTLIESVPASHRRQHTILVLMAPVEFVAMDSIVQSLIRTATVICWGEKRFWDKLRFALPDLAHNQPIKKLDNITNLRYTPAPTTLDSWCKVAHPDAPAPIVEHQTTPSISTSHTEDDDSCTSSQNYDNGGNGNYRTSASSLGHVYSTIPETTANNGRGGQAFFV